MTDEKKPKIKWPAGAKDVTEENLGKTIVIIGYPRPSKPKPKPEETEPPAMVSFVDADGRKSAAADIAWHNQQKE